MPFSTTSRLFTPLLLAAFAVLFSTSFAAPEVQARSGAEAGTEGDDAAGEGNERASRDRPQSGDRERPGAATEANEPIFPWVGEELYYSVRINNSEAIRAGIRTGDVRRRGGRNYVPVNGMARSRGFFNAVYPIDDQANTYLDPDTSFPLRSEKTFEENNRLRRYDVDYKHGSYIAKVERVRGDRETHFQAPIPPDTHDMVTWLYDLRRVGDIAIGDEFSYYIYDGWLLSRVDLEVKEREDLLTPMGWFKTWRLDFARQIMNVERQSRNDDNPTPKPPNINVREERRHTGSLWLSRDVNYLPVRVTIDTMLGPGEAVIIGYTPGRAR